MIEINLLPEELKIKKKKKIELSKIPLMPFFFVTISILMFAHVALIIAVNVNKSKLGALKKTWESYAPKRKETDLLKNNVKRINDRVKTIEELTKKRVLWARKLNSLSNVIPPNIWLSKLAYVEKINVITLTIEGYAAGTTDEGTAYVARFIKALKSDASFFEDFKDIELGSMRTSLIEGQEVMNFKLICTFKPKQN